MKLKDLEIYTLARKNSFDAWRIYQNLDWEQRKIIGSQFIRAVDSVAANIAEGFGRFHFLDKNKFNYNARGSLMESMHWVDLLSERSLISEECGDSLYQQMNVLCFKLNHYITATKKKAAK